MTEELILRNLLAEVVYPRSEGEYSATSWSKLLPHIGPRIKEIYGWNMFKNQEAFLRVVKERNVVNASETATGKTEATYTVVCEEKLKRKRETGEPDDKGFATAGRVALYLFPNNALLFDQEARFREHNAALMAGELRIARYTTDLNLKERRKIREAAGRGEIDILLMTLYMWKDTLYSALVRGEEGWVRTLASPWLLVCDEVDYYSGYSLAYIFTLYRILKKYNAEVTKQPIRVVFNSATIPNAEELAQQVLDNATVVRGKARHGTIRLYTYGLDTGRVNKKKGRITVFDRFLDQLKTGAIYAGKSVVIYADNKFLLERAAVLKELTTNNFGIIHGDLPWAEKRQMLQRFRAGQLRGLLVTRAVEAGLNFGQLELLIILGFPSGGKRGLHQEIMRVARHPDQVGEVYWFLTIKGRMDSYYLEHRDKLQELVERLEPEPVDYTYFSEKLLRSALFLCGALGLTQQDFTWLFPFTPAEYLQEKVIEVLTDYLAAGLVQRTDGEFQTHLKKSEEVFFTLGLMTALPELRVRTRSGKLVGYIDLEKVAQTGLPGNYLLLGKRVWKVVKVTKEEVIVEETTKLYYSKNPVEREIRKGRGTWDTRPQGRVVAWFGELEVLLMAKTLITRNLQTHELIEKKRSEIGGRYALYRTEGLTVRLKGHRFTLHEALHLGAAVLRAAQQELALDPGELEVHPLRDERRRGYELLIFDRGGPTGASKQLFEHLKAVLQVTRNNLTTCRCRMYCEACVWLRALVRGYSPRAHGTLRYVFRRVG
ncbi:MAG: helicase-related protein [Candidatus Heimdallarchaeota archaeon]